jgi:hypothetical protein
MTPLQRLMALFAGNDTHYGTHGAPSRDPTGESLKWVIKPTAKTLKGAPTEKMWKDHVDGKKPLGIVPIRTDNSTIWGSIDYDVYGQDLTDLIKRVEALKLPLVPGRSKSGGLHLFCFTIEPVEASLMQEVLRDISAALGIAGSEIFPKQTTILTDRGDQGSWMIMPYYGDTYDGKLERQVGLRKNGSEIGLPEFVRIAEKARLSQAQLEELKVRHLKAQSPASKAKGGKRGSKHDDPSVPFGDGPPCLVHMIAEGGVKQGSAGGGQNNALFHMGVYYKKKNPDGWEEDLERAAQLYCTPAHPRQGVDSIIKSLRKKDYEYKCKDEPMRSHCNSILCRKRKHGVTGGGGGGLVPSITSIKKMNSDPPVWFLEVEGKKVECNTEDLQRWERFQRILINVCHDPFGVIPQPVWLATIQEAMQGMTEIIEVGADAGARGEFHELLETYLTNRQRGMKEEDLLSGRPWESEDERRYYFVLSRLHRFLEREGLKGLNKPQIVTRIQELCGEEPCHVVREIKGKRVNLHWIPSDKVQITPSVSTPTLKEKPI